MLAIVLAVISVVAEAQTDDTIELAVKATYLYKLPPFVTWPSSAFTSETSPFRICVAGRDPFGDLLDKAVAGRRLNDRPVALARVGEFVQNSQCQLLYIPANEPEQTRLLQTAAGMPVLTVTDSPPGGAKGIVNFVVRDNHVRLEIDQGAAARAGLSISSKLLSVATSVTPK